MPGIDVSGQIFITSPIPRARTQLLKQARVIPKSDVSINHADPHLGAVGVCQGSPSASQNNLFA